MKTKLLKKLRKKAEKRYRVVKDTNNSYSVVWFPEYLQPRTEKTFSALDWAIKFCDTLRRNYILLEIANLKYANKKAVY